MTLQFRNNWNVGNLQFNDAVMIPMLNPDQDFIQTVLNEAYLNGNWNDPATQRLFAAAANPRGPIVAIRAGAHQIENQPGGGFRLHIGALFEGINWHLNIQQTNTGHMYVDSVSRGNPNQPNYNLERRTGAVPR
jgi:hypothetical protein